MEIDPDDPKGRKLRRKGDHSFVVPAELVVVAAGQGKLTDLLSGIPGVTLDRGRIVVDDDGRTSNPKVYAGGDVANGGKEVVNAVAEGKRAARAIHEALSR